MPQNNPANNAKYKLMIETWRRLPHGLGELAGALHRAQPGLSPARNGSAMANVLYLVHRLPYPPNKGDKVRSYHVLRHLAAQHKVFLGTFVDDPDDQQHVPTLGTWCADVLALPLHPKLARAASLAGLLTGEALTLRYYRDSRLQRWVDRTVREAAIDAIVVFSSSMAPYAEPHGAVPMLLDLVDVDSAKWTAYAEAHRGPLAWLYGREGRRLLAYERAAAARAQRTFLVTDNEAGLFRSLAPEVADRVEVSCNGVDAEHFTPDPARASPFASGERPLVFTGAMDYWPNVDAVCWFAEAVLPQLRARWPGLRLHVVGRSPTPAVRALAGEAVAVTGTVPDVRPYLQHAAVVVAPLRLARGVQNKVLEAMAMGRPVVAAASCVAAVDARPGEELLPAAEVDDYVQQIDLLLQQPQRAEQVGAAGRACVLQRYSWTARLSGIDHVLASSTAGQEPPARALAHPEPA